MGIAYDFIKMAWDHAGGDPHSWEAYNTQVRKTAITAAEGLPWTQYDLDLVLELRNHRFSITKAVDIEDLYAAAVRRNNTSAYTEIERHLGRPPIIADDVSWKYDTTRRKRSRICVGAEFVYGGHRVRCNSFRADGRANCAAYEKGRTSPVKLFALASADIIADRKRRKEA